MKFTRRNLLRSLIGLATLPFIGKLLIQQPAPAADTTVKMQVIGTPRVDQTRLVTTIPQFFLTTPLKHVANWESETSKQKTLFVFDRYPDVILKTQPKHLVAYYPLGEV